MKRIISPAFLILILCIGLIAIQSTNAQDSMVDLFKNDLKTADDNFHNKNYQLALSGYNRAAEKNQKDDLIPLKIAKCYYYTKQYMKAVNTYQRYIDVRKDLPDTDLYYFAEALASIGSYDKAIIYYEKCLSKDPENEIIIKKIWRLSNRTYLLEDSIYFTVKESPINTLASDFSAVAYKNGIVFSSNREEIKWIKKIDATTNQPFYQTYFASVYKDPQGMGSTKYGTPEIFGKSLQSDFNTGPICFYDDGKKMVFVKSSEKKSSANARTLQIHFAEYKNGAWQVANAFPFNSLSFSNTNPGINNEGNRLYFASDKPGGIGGMDIYVSEFLEGKWTNPENLGPDINTIGDEVFPYLHRNSTLYFSSNGHAGLGGLDIFKVELIKGGFSELENLGYPLNSGHDDFGIFIDSSDISGFLSSNRKNGGFDDDIYEFEMGLQPYPMTVTGLVKFIEHNWMDSTELKTLPDVTLSLIDDVKNMVVAETVSDNEGNFKLIVPYYSKYKVRVVGGGIEGIVSFEVPKHKKVSDGYDIVVVNDDFKTVSN